MLCIAMQMEDKREREQSFEVLSERRRDKIYVESQHIGAAKQQDMKLLPATQGRKDATCHQRHQDQKTIEAAKREAASGAHCMQLGTASDA